MNKKKIILIMLLLSFIGISSAMSKKSKTIPQEEQLKTTLVNKTTEDIPKEKYMPKKLIYSELPDDYPKELDELFRFYYMEIRNKPEYIENWKDYIKKIPIKRKGQLLYLDWLATQTIPLYYEEYKRINQTRIDYMSLEKQKSVSVLPQRDWDYMAEYKRFRNSSPQRYIQSIKMSIEEEEDRKFNFLGDIASSIFVKAVISDKKCMFRKIIEYPKLSYQPTCYLKIKILDSVGNKFLNNEIIVRLILHFQKQKEFPKLPNLSDLKIGDKYLFCIHPIMNKSLLFEDTINYNNGIRNDNLSYFSSLRGNIWRLKNDNIIFSSNQSIFPLKNKFSTYKELEERLAKEINYIKDFYTRRRR